MGILSDEELMLEEYQLLEAPSLEKVKKITQGDFESYLLQSFRQYEELDINVELLPKSYFKG